VDLAALVETHTVFTAQEVDTAAVYEEGSADLSYPTALLQARTRGRVVVEFVVDTLGKVEERSITVVTATNTAFADAARVAAARGRFAPAVLNRRRVRQLVRIGLDFDPGALPPAPSDSLQNRGRSFA
jgi:protein TonB